jgi:hypothetical protein
MKMNALRVREIGEIENSLPDYAITVVAVVVDSAFRFHVACRSAEIQ